MKGLKGYNAGISLLLSGYLALGSVDSHAQSAASDSTSTNTGAVFLRDKLNQSSRNTLEGLTKRLSEGEVDSYIRGSPVGLSNPLNIDYVNETTGYRFGPVSSKLNLQQLPSENARYGEKAVNAAMIIGERSGNIADNTLKSILLDYIQRVSGRTLNQSNIALVKNRDGNVVAASYTGQDRKGLEPILRDDNVFGSRIRNLVMIYNNDNNLSSRLQMESYLNIPFWVMEEQAYRAMIDRNNTSSSVSDALNYPLGGGISDSVIAKAAYSDSLAGIVERQRTALEEARRNALPKKESLSWVKRHPFATAMIAAGAAAGAGYAVQKTTGFPFGKKKSDPSNIPASGGEKGGGSVTTKWKNYFYF